MTVSGADLVRWELANGAAREAMRIKLADASAGGAHAACWDPHNRASTAVAVGCSLRLADVRSGQTFVAISNAHRYACRDVDYNPHKPNHIVTCGEDR